MGGTSALHTISAYATASGLTLRQESTRGKGNEIAAIRALLDTLYLKGCIVTIDAIGCQMEIARTITERGGDYLLAVKDNQKRLAEALREFFAEGERLCTEQMRPGYGRGWLPDRRSARGSSPPAEPLPLHVPQEAPPRVGEDKRRGVVPAPVPSGGHNCPVYRTAPLALPG